MTNRADLYLPLFVAGRDFADHVADQLGDRPGEPIVVDATGLQSGTSSFAARLVRRVLIDGKASELTIVGAPDEFARYLRDAADRDGVADKVTTSQDFPQPTS
jgi:uncharacterized Fe-S center protein